jgi:hypothetical protein
MMVVKYGALPSKSSSESGIAIGPILFIVAILGILAAALAAGGSGSFTGNSQGETARIKAAALIQIGSILKVGMVRMTGGGTDFDSVNINPDDTTGGNDLFSPTGGSVNVPSVTLSNDPTIDVWYYPQAAVPQMGTAATERLALLKITQSVCNEVNRKANATLTDAADSSMTADIGDVTAVSLSGAAAWPAPLLGKEIGCIHNSNGTTAGYFYYQILGIR